MPLTDLELKDVKVGDIVICRHDCRDTGSCLRNGRKYEIVAVEIPHPWFPKVGLRIKPVGSDTAINYLWSTDHFEKVD